MAEQTIEGLGGNVTFAQDFNMKIGSWSADYAIETVDTTGFDDGGFRTKEAVMTQITGSAVGTGLYDAADTAPLHADIADGVTMAVGDLANAFGAMTLTAFTGCTYGFNATITRVAFNRPVDGKLEITFDFKSSGVIVQTWDEA